MIGKNNYNPVAVNHVNTADSINKKRLIWEMFRNKKKGTNLTPKKKKRKKRK
jgi:hypothetical protein